MFVHYEFSKLFLHLKKTGTIFEISTSTVLRIEVIFIIFTFFYQLKIANVTNSQSIFQN